MTRALIRTFIARAAAAFGSIVLVWVLGRLFGAGGVGVFAVAQSLLMGVALVARFGMDNTLMRYVGQAPHSRSVPSYLRWATSKALVVAVPLSAAVYLLRSPVAEVFGQPGLVDVLPGIALAAPAFTLGFILSGFFKGIGQPATACLLEHGAISLVAAALFWVWQPVHADAAYQNLGVGYALAAWLVVVYGLYRIVMWRYRWRPADDVVHIDRYELGSTSRSFFVMSLSFFVQAVLVMLVAGLYLDSHDLGLFKTAYQVGASIAFILIVINAVIPAKMAGFFYRNDWKGLEEVARKSAILGAGLTFPLVVLCLVFPAQVLGLFGDEFREGATLLRIIAAGQFVNVASGSVGFVLNMTGHEKLMRNIALASGLICVAGLFVLIPLFGSVGAAAALGLALMLQNLVAVFYVWRRLDIWMLPVPNVLAMAGVGSKVQSTHRGAS